MSTSLGYPAAVIDLADSWHRLAQAQLALSQCSQRARDAVPIEELRHELSDAFAIAVDLQPEAVKLRIRPRAGRPERLHVWATPDLLVVRTEAATTIEHLVRLPAPADPNVCGVEIHDGVMIVTLSRREDLPEVLWPAART